MKEYFSYFKYSILLIVGIILQLSVEASDTNLSSVRLSGHIPKAVEQAVFVENLASTANVPLTFIIPLRDTEVLEELIQRIYDPMDQQYGKYLTSEEFIERFAPTQEDYNEVIAYAKNLGLSITGTHPNRTLLNVMGPASSVEKAFNLSLQLYQLPSGRKFHAPNNNPEVPVSIATLVNGIVGLDNHAVWRAFNQKRQEAEEELSSSNSTSFTSPSGPKGGYAPNDLLTAYNLAGVAANGSGQTIALFELASYQASDINAYTTYFGLPSAKLNNILVDGGSSSGINVEVTLDIELAIAFAPQSQIYVYEGPNSEQGVLDTYNKIATDNLAKQVSTSWGIPENLMGTQYIQAENAIFLQMAAHGQTVYAAAGDSGAYGDYPDNSSLTLAVDDPASQPYVVGVGGTKLTVNPATGVYVSEAVWNNGLGHGAGGGGVSGAWSIPSWQTNVSTVYSKVNRNVPDISLHADTNPGYAIYHNGQWGVYGGTSCAAPLWAAFTARMNQELASNQKPALGFLNPALYALALSSSYATNLNDVTTGNNLYYSAGSGYDNATGWGSFNGAHLFASLTNPSSPTPPQVSPLLTLAIRHAAPFARGGIGTYVIDVSNTGNGSTSGPVTVAITLPSGLSYKSLTGAGWVFNPTTLTCTQTAPLKAGASYASIVLKVNVSLNAPNSFTPIVTVSGGGSTSSTITNRTTSI